MADRQDLDSELERLRAEVAVLRATEAHHHSVLAAMTEGVIVRDASGTVLACNEAAEEILGLTRDQLIGQAARDPRWRAIREDGSPFPEDMLPAIVTLRTGEASRDVVMGVHKADGRLTWIAINTRIVPGAPGAPCVVCTIREITHYKQALADLQASEARLQLAMRAARMGTWQWEVGDDQVIWSDTVEDVFGIPHGTFSGGFAAYLELIHPDDRAQVRGEIEGVLGDDAARDSFHVRHRVGHADRWIECHGRIFRDAHGRPLRMAGVAIDITEVHRLEQQLHQSRRLEAIGRLAGGIAHDFNNVLTVILSAVDLRMLRGGDARAELEMIRDAAQRASQLTSQLLSFARSRAAGVATVDVGALLIALRPLLVRLLGERIALEMTIVPGHAPVRADAGQLEQVLINLVANARDAIADTGHVRIVLEAASSGEELVISVEDDGMGMPPDVLARVFEPFFTTKAAGTGLGLATSYGIVRQHGGHIDVTSTVGAGSRFAIRLPRIVAGDAGDVAAELATIGRPRGHETLLLVEDDDLVRRVAQQILGEQGYHVLVAADGVEALAVAQAHADDIALVLTDAVMPRMGGAELARNLRAQWPALPILVISGYNPEDRPGVDALPRLDKPYTPVQLVHRVRDLLDRARVA